MIKVINSNMRCIETRFLLRSVMRKLLINSNMRCIETRIVAMEFIPNTD